MKKEGAALRAFWGRTSLLDDARKALGARRIESSMMRNPCKASDRFVAPISQIRLYRRPGQRYNLKRKAEVAQLVEQLIRNQQVVGSSPTFGSTKLN